MTLGSLGFFFFLAIAKIKRGGRGKSFMGLGDLPGGARVWYKWPLISFWGKRVGISGNCGDPDPNARIGRKTTLEKGLRRPEGS